MNKLVKIAPIVVVIACLGSLFFAFKLAGTKSQLKEEKATLTEDVQRANSELGKAKDQAQQYATTAQQAQNAAAAAAAEAQVAKTELAAKAQEAETAASRASELEKQAQETAAKLATAEDMLKKIQESTQTASATGEAAGDIGTKLVALGDENKLLSEQLINMRNETQRLRTELSKQTETPTGLRGKVAAVEDAWSFVVLNIGRTQNVQPNSEFIVYRDTKMVSKVQVVNVGRETCVAEILPEYNIGKPQVGDMVLH
jgi:chromosome segregation ATPase